MNDLPEFAWTMPFYAPAFPVDLAFELGKTGHNLINESIYGKVASRPEDLGILSDMIKHAGGGDHLELGVFMGGTAIMAALAKKRHGLDGKIVCIDNFTYMKGEYPVGPEMVLNNAKTLDVDDYMEIIVANTNPLPDKLRGREFTSANIDADHSYEACKADFLAIRDIVTRYIMFHDYDYNHMGVIRAVHDAARDPGWNMVLIMGNTAVLEKRK